MMGFWDALASPFWYWLTQVAQEKWPLNECSSYMADSR